MTVKNLRWNFWHEETLMEIAEKVLVLLVQHNIYNLPALLKDILIDATISLFWTSIMLFQELSIYSFQKEFQKQR